MKTMRNFGLIIGTGFGLTVGISTDNLGVWLPVGFALGFLLGRMGHNVAGSESAKSCEKETEAPPAEDSNKD